jgi:hypothetical protein
MQLTEKEWPVIDKLEETFKAFKVALMDAEKIGFGMNLSLTMQPQDGPSFMPSILFLTNKTELLKLDVIHQFNMNFK